MQEGSTAIDFAVCRCYAIDVRGCECGAGAQGMRMRLCAAEELNSKLSAARSHQHRLDDRQRNRSKLQCWWRRMEQRKCNQQWNRSAQPQQPELSRGLCSAASHSRRSLPLDTLLPPCQTPPLHCYSHWRAIQLQAKPGTTGQIAKRRRCGRWMRSELDRGDRKANSPSNEGINLTADPPSLRAQFTA